MNNQIGEPDLTPILDVVFILLIFFIVSATFVKELGVDLPGQNARPQTQNASEMYLIEIDAGDKYNIDYRPVDKRALLHHLTRLHTKKPEQPFVIKPAHASTTSALVYAIDSANQVGIKVALAAY